MAKYHSYVFDMEQQSFVGKFEEMYQAEQTEQFDSWHQEDLRDLTKRICFEVLNRYNFDRILDIGCGKGAFTQFLKKRNNHVVAIDVSETALSVAQSRYPDIAFQHVDIGDTSFKNQVLCGRDFDLVVYLEVLSYIEHWPALLEAFSKIGRYTLITLFIPENPIGYVKSFDELRLHFQNYYDVIEEIHLINRKQIVLFGKSLSLS